MAETREQLGATTAELRTRLSDRDYQIFHCHFFDGKSYAEIGLMFGMTGERVRDHCRGTVREFRKVFLKLSNERWAAATKRLGHIRQESWQGLANLPRDRPKAD